MKFAVLKTKEGVGEAMFSTTVGGKDYRVEFNKGNNFTFKVPTPLTYQDPFDKARTVVARENYARDLLLAYPDLIELVSDEETSLAEEVQVEVQKAQTSKQKGKKHEKDS